MFKSRNSCIFQSARQTMRYTTLFTILRGGDVARGAHAGSKRAFVTDERGRIIREVTQDRVKVRFENEVSSGKVFEGFRKAGPPSAKDLGLLRLLD